MYPEIDRSYIKIYRSKIHSRGVFARQAIPAGAPVIEYVGEKVTKKESLRRADLTLEKSKKDEQAGAVYLFELNRHYDIDGNVRYNPARLINHSCDPNCEAEIEDNRIWIKALRNIACGEELTYNYGYDLECFEEHPCRCGSDRCVGYIVDEDHWPKLQKKLQRRAMKV